MQVPQTISSNTFAVYGATKRIPWKSLDAEDLVEWKKRVPKRLSELCLMAICRNWEENPILDELTLDQDARLLLDSLPLSLPYELTVSKIDDELFWRRCYRSRWPNKPPVPKPKTDLVEVERSSKVTSRGSSRSSSNLQMQMDDDQEKLSGINEDADDVDSNDDDAEKSLSLNEIAEEQILTWKRCFLEMHLKEYLENLLPDDYNPHNIKQLVDLCKKYVTTLHLAQLKAPLNIVEGKSSDYIPLRSIISGLPLLSDLKICFKQTYAGEHFKWDILQTTMNDVNSLAMGLKKCNLTSLSIINSDVDCDKVILLVKSLLHNNSLRMLDFSHCKIANRGTIAITKLLKETPTLECINISNNYVGTDGVEVLAYVIAHCFNGLKVLDLSLNNIGVAGGNFIGTALGEAKCVLEDLILGGCGLTTDSWLLVKAIVLNTKLEKLNMSSNRLNEDTGKIMLEMVKRNYTLKKLDIRMCGISPATNFAIEELLGNAILPIDELYKNEVIRQLPKFPVVDMESKLDTIFPENVEGEGEEIIDYVEAADEDDSEYDDEIHSFNEEDEEYH